MKKLSTTLVALSFILGLVSCGTGKEINPTEEKTEIEADVWGEEDSKEIVSTEIVESSVLSQIPAFSAEFDFNYVPETDAQCDLGQNSNIVYTENGSYQILYNDLQEKNIYFKDKASGVSVPLCSRTNCIHEMAGCDANLGSEYPINVIAYQENYLYVLKTENEDLVIEKISEDGATREKSCTLMKLNNQTVVNEDGSVSTSFFYPEFQIHRGYVYFSTYYAGCEEVSLCRLKLDSKEEAEVLFTISENSPCLYRIKPYGNFILFQMGNFDESYNNFGGAIYCFDINKKEISRICEEGIRSYCIWRNNIYYCDLNDNIMKKDLQTGEISNFYETTISSGDFNITIFGLGDNLFYEINNINTGEKEQVVLDEKGNEVSRLTKKEVVVPYSF